MIDTTTHKVFLSMEAALAILGVFVGSLIGVIAYDFAQRLKDRLALKEAEDKFVKSQAALSELHNSSTKNLKDLADKYTTLEHQLRMIKPVEGPTVTRKFT